MISSAVTTKLSGPPRPFRTATGRSAKLAAVFIAALLLAALFSLLAPSPTAAAPLEAPSGYVVRPGDTLGSIAARHGVSVSALARANGIVNIDRIYIGQNLVIPGQSGGTPTQPTQPTQPSAPAAGTGTYIVQPGDTLAKIAARYGTTVARLVALNGLANPDRIWVGQRLKVSGSAGGGGTKPPTGGSTAGRWIDVDISSQTLTAYQGNTPVFSALVSTGLPRTPTVIGRFKIYTKLTSTRMRGPGYDLPNVPYTMYFYKGYGIHGTYWHNNFGHPMSHGCVNMRTQDAGWLFNWASIGTPVVTHW